MIDQGKFQGADVEPKTVSKHERPPCHECAWQPKTGLRQAKTLRIFSKTPGLTTVFIELGIGANAQQVWL